MQHGSSTTTHLSFTLFQTLLALPKIHSCTCLDQYCECSLSTQNHKDSNSSTASVFNLCFGFRPFSSCFWSFESELCPVVLLSNTMLLIQIVTSVDLILSFKNKSKFNVKVATELLHPKASGRSSVERFLSQYKGFWAGCLHKIG